MGWHGRMQEDNSGFSGVQHMAKYKIEVGSFSTRFVQRHLMVYAKDEAEARKKAIDLYLEKEIEAGSVDPGEPRVDEIIRI